MITRNRRYTYLMKELIESDYFEEENIKMRHPLLYHMYIGRYQQQTTSSSSRGHEVQKFLFAAMDKQ